MAGAPDTFLTLTTRRNSYGSPEIAALAMSHAWRCLRLRIIRKYRLARLPFLAVFEKHVSGWPHMHLLMRAPFIDYAWLKAQWIDLTGSSVVRIERIYNKRKASGYCAKYCSKAVHKIGTAKRYWQSADYDQREPYEPEHKGGDDGVWEIRRTPFKRIIAAWKEAGNDVSETGLSSAYVFFNKELAPPSRRGAPLVAL